MCDMQNTRASGITKLDGDSWIDRLFERNGLLLLRCLATTHMRCVRIIVSIDGSDKHSGLWNICNTSLRLGHHTGYSLANSPATTFPLRLQCFLFQIYQQCLFWQLFKCWWFTSFAPVVYFIARVSIHFQAFVLIATTLLCSFTTFTSSSFQSAEWPRRPLVPLLSQWYCEHRISKSSLIPMLLTKCWHYENIWYFY